MLHMNMQNSFGRIVSAGIILLVFLILLLTPWQVVETLSNKSQNYFNVFVYVWRFIKPPPYFWRDLWHNFDFFFLKSIFFIFSYFLVKLSMFTLLQVWHDCFRGNLEHFGLFFESCEHFSWSIVWKNCKFLIFINTYSWKHVFL